MEDKLISELDYVSSSGYTLNDLLVLVNYDIPEGTTKNTKISDIKNYILDSVSADTNTYITGFTYTNNTFNLYDNSGNMFSATIDQVTGFTVNGSLSASTISGGTFHGDGSQLSGVVGLSYSDLGFTITSPTPTTINQNVVLPYNSTVTYPSPLTVDSGFSVTIPSGTTLTII